MYKILGADGREYGPVPPEQIRKWIAEGRANGQTLTRAENQDSWKPLLAFTEFGPDLAARAYESNVPPAPAVPPAGEATNRRSPPDCWESSSAASASTAFTWDTRRSA